MKKKLLSIILFCLLLCVGTRTIAGQQAEKGAEQGPTAPQGTEQKMDADVFLDKFVEAWEANDQAKMEELVRQARPDIVFNVISEFADYSFKDCAEGKEGFVAFNVLEVIAVPYAKVHKKEGLLELVRRYKGYTPEMCKEKLRGDDLIEEGLALYGKGQYQEALDACRQSLEIFRRIGDVSREAISLIGIGDVYYKLGQYQEALDSYRQSLEIFRRIGDVSREVISLVGIGNAYYGLGQYQEALSHHMQSLGIVRRIGDVSGQAYKAIDQGKMEELIRQAGPDVVFNVVIELADCSIKDRAEGKDGSTYSDAAEVMAAVYATVSKKEGLLELVRRYKGYTPEMCKEKLRGDNLSNEGSALYKKGQWKESLERWDEALKMFQRIGDACGETRSFGSIGVVYHELGQYEKAREYYNQALEIARKIEDVADEAKSLNGMGVAYKDLGQYEKAVEYHRQALEIKRKIRDIADEAKYLNDIGVAYNSLGQYAKALENYGQALELARKIGDVATDVEARSLIGIGVIYHELGQYEKAREEYYEQALEIYRKTGDKKGEVVDLNNIGLAYTDLGQYEKAIEYHLQALEIAQKIDDQKDESASLASIGNLYYIVDLYAEAMEYFKQSLEIDRKIGYVAGEAHTLNNIGLCYFNLKQYSKAIETLQKSIKISEQFSDLETAWRSYRGLGEALWKSGKGEEAIAQYKKAVEVIEELYQFTKGFREEERSSMIGKKLHVYKEFIELLLELHKKSPNKGYDKEAFIISEKTKSRTFQELMAKAGAKIVFAGEVKDETFKKMVEKEQQLIVEITNLRTLLTQELAKPEKERSQEVIDSLKSQLSKSEKTLSDLEKEIEAKYPRYADLKRPKPLIVEELQEILKPDEMVISYAVGKDKLVAFVIAKGCFKMIELSIRPGDVAQLVKQFRRGLEDIYELKDLEQFDPETAYTLFQWLIAPLSADLKGVTKLYISADGILYTLPFEALVDQEVNTKAFREARRQGRQGRGAYLGEYATLHYVVETYTITYLPSASVLRSMRKYEKAGYGKWAKPLIAFADPIFGSEEKAEGKKGVQSKGVSKETELTAQILTRSTGSKGLDRLKESAQEAEVISKELKGKKEDIYLREKATEENIYKTNLKDSRYLLFSTHGLLGGDFSGVAEPALALTLIDNPPGRDGFLTMSEVLGLDLNSELIILSACNTSGKGDKAGEGEGFVGLTRSFMYAGGKSLLVTHWSVESESARDLMVNTMRLMKGKTRPDALREAKLSMKKSIRQKGKEKLSLSHPFFWAPFVLVGDGK
jgi:tetratricopeptide (TPR) repeat protein